MFSDLLVQIDLVTKSAPNFQIASEELTAYINQTDKESFLNILKEIGTIPESIPHDSTAEKLFAKVSDAVLSRAFSELGLKSSVMIERADAADVLAESYIYGYTLVADAKAFRLSRTAKNQKDFKVTALSTWRQDNDYAVLCSPLYHYPTRTSQIYKQALTENVCLLAWEHIIFMIENDIKESTTLNLSMIWNFSSIQAEKTSVKDMKKCFIESFNSSFANTLNYSVSTIESTIREHIKVIEERSIVEKQYWFQEIDTIKNYTKEIAIEELIKARKINEKITQIDKFVRGIKLVK